MEQATRICRIEIAGRWTADDMARSFADIRDLYSLRLALEVIYEEERSLERYDPFYRELIYLRRRGFAGPYGLLRHSVFRDNSNVLAVNLFPEEELTVKRVSYASPGFKDLAGIGEIVQHISEFLKNLMDMRLRHRRMELENEELQIRNDKGRAENETLRIENEARRIENRRQFLRLQQESRSAQIEERRLLQFVNKKEKHIAKLIDESKITGVEIDPAEE